MSTQYMTASKDPHSTRRPTYPFEVPAGYKMLPMTQVQAYGVDPSAAYALVPASSLEGHKSSRRRSSADQERRGESRRDDQDRREPTRPRDIPRSKYSEYDEEPHHSRPSDTRRRDDRPEPLPSKPSRREDRSRHDESPPRHADAHRSKHDISYRHVDRHEVRPRRSYERDESPPPTQSRYEPQQTVPPGILRNKKDPDPTRPSRKLQRRRSSFPTERPRRLAHRPSSPPEKHVHWA